MRLVFENGNKSKYLTGWIAEYGNKTLYFHRVHICHRFQVRLFQKELISIKFCMAYPIHVPSYFAMTAEFISSFISNQIFILLRLMVSPAFHC